MLIRAFTLLSVLLAGAAAPAASQSATGRIVGRVIDAASGEPIPGARVVITAASIAGRTDMNGRYTLLNVPTGTHTVTVRSIGYAEKSVTGVAVTEGAVVPLDISLTVTAVEVAGIEVTAEVERGSVSRALEEQRAASNIVSSLSQEQIQRSPDSDAGQAVQRVSGVTVQDGRYVFVRGLGERYTTTSLNNTRIPSPEPERKVVPLDLFPAGLLQSITTSKTFTPDQPGDFTGAQVDLRTR
ncbi:MAG TPA: carboxypeptidase regulatory-like domain-containing protein, partial [Gemmatimonadales bacterium]|nr:carboxypeptidase regulatory-like domain-containing protein [Gemmatimonadales bacterium]